MSDVYWQRKKIKYFADKETAVQPVKYVLALVEFQQRFLLGNIQNRGWCAPSGKIEPGEQPEQAIIREIYEETGADIKALTRIGYYEITEDNMTCYSLIYTAKAVQLKPMPQSESLGVDLFSLADVPSVYHDWNSEFEKVFCEAGIILDIK